MKKNFLLLIVMTAFLSFGFESSFAQGRSKVISTKEFAKKIKSDGKAVVLDLRTDNEVVDGMIEGAIQLDFNGDGFYDMVQEMDKSKNYYIYCKSGGRSGKAAELMESLGYNVFDLSGGITEWIVKGNPLKKE